MGRSIDIHDDITKHHDFENPTCEDSTFVPLTHKIIAEVLGTFFLIFVGCGVALVNDNNEKVITFPGVAIVWGLVVMVLIYSLGHVSGAHFNPAVTIAFATIKKFPWSQVPVYIASQLLGSTLAAFILRIVFTEDQYHFVGTMPSGSNTQSFIIEFIITFYLMFIISGVCTDNRANSELGGLAVGCTILINVMFAGPVTGASMNPARSIGPAIVSQEYNALWIYIVSPTLGVVSGACFYNLVRTSSKPK